MSSQLLADLVVILSGLGAAALMLTLREWLRRSDLPSLDAKIGSPDWDFSKSWASTLAAFAAVFNVIIATSLLPHHPRYLQPADINALSVLFGILLFVAALLYNAFRDEVPKDPDDASGSYEFQGTVGLFLTSSAVTIWAVLGELATIFFVALDMWQARSGSPFVALLFAVTIVATACLVAIYGWRSARQTIRDYRIFREAAARHDVKALAEMGVIAAPDARAQLPRWSVL